MKIEFELPDHVDAFSFTYDNKMEEGRVLLLSTRKELLHKEDGLIPKWGIENGLFPMFLKELSDHLKKKIS